MATEPRLIAVLQFLVAEEPWKQEATCQVEHADPTLFILEQGQRPEQARTYCGRCPVRPECLEYGKRSGSVGVWGGEVLEMKNRDAVQLRPISYYKNTGNLENLVNPPPLKDHQDPLAMFG
jgi:hypothetical protein